MARQRRSVERASGRVIILKGRAKAIAKLTLHGPTEEPEGRALAAKLNAVVAIYNTRWFMNADGSKVTPRIEATTGPIS